MFTIDSHNRKLVYRQTPVKKVFLQYTIWNYSTTSFLLFAVILELF